MTLNLAAGRGVTQVVERCENAKESGFLDLSSCSLMFIADAVYLLLKGYEVDKVSLLNNSLKKFPRKMVQKFPNLTIINMEGNQIEEIPEELSGWTKLKGTNMSKNKISQFPKAFYSLSEVMYIDLSGNSIESLDADLLYTSLPKLTQLNLKENPIDEETRKALELSQNRPKNLILLL